MSFLCHPPLSSAFEGRVLVLVTSRAYLHIHLSRCPWGKEICYGTEIPPWKRRLNCENNCWNDFFLSCSFVSLTLNRCLWRLCSVLVTFRAYFHIYFSRSPSGKKENLWRYTNTALERSIALLLDLDFAQANKSSLNLYFRNNTWAAPSENVPLDMCAQQRFRSACAFAQSDQNLHWPLFRYPRMQ